MMLRGLAPFSSLIGGAILSSSAFIPPFHHLWLQGLVGREGRLPRQRLRRVDFEWKESIPEESTRAMAISMSSAISLPISALSSLRLGSQAFGHASTLKVAPGAARAPKCRSLEVSAMAKREQQLVEIRQMTDESIGQTVTDLKGELFVLRCKQATRQEYKSSDFRKIRKQIARMLTVRREREVEKGISVRESRKLDREWKKNVVIRPPASLASINKSS